MFITFLENNMKSSLGIYIENDLIKYAKLHDENGEIILGDSGTVFYNNNLSEKIEEIIRNTNSFNSIIYANVINEISFSFEVSSYLSENDLRKSINIEVKLYCDANNLNIKEYFYKYSIVKKTKSVKNVCVIMAKIDEIDMIRSCIGSNLKGIISIYSSINNLINDSVNDYIIVNISDKINVISFLDKCMQEIKSFDLEKLNEEIFINYLYKNRVKDIYFVGNNCNDIKYFVQNNLNEINCITLYPDFLTYNEYTENIIDAVSLALCGQINNLETINYICDDKMSIKELLLSDVSIDNFKRFFSSRRQNYKFNYLNKNRSVKLLITRIIVISIIFLCGYIIFHNISYNNIQKQCDYISSQIKELEIENNKINSYINKINEEIYEDNTLLNTIENKNDLEEIEDILISISAVMPNDVRMKYINYNINNEIELRVESNKYEQIGLFLANLRNKNIIDNISTTETSKNGSLIEIIIKGDIP